MSLDHPTRIMFVVTRGDSIGGAQIHVRDLATHLTRDGHSVHVVTGIAGPLTEQLAVAGVPSTIVPGLLREIDPLRDAGAVRALVRVMRAERPELISTHSSKAGVIGRIAARVTGVPAIFTAHGWAFTDGVPEPKRTVYRLVERLHAPLARRIICVSEHDRAIGERAGIRATRLRVVHNGMPDITPELRAAPGRETPRPRAVMIARFDQQKDHATLLEALSRVPGLTLDLIGDGPGREAVEASVTRLRLCDRVQLLGQRPDVAERLADADLFVLSSRWEGFPRSTLEAMRAGLPVIVSRVGGAAEAVVEGETGFVVAPGDIATLADRLQRLRDDAALRGAMGAAGRARYEERFTFERMYAETSAVYAEALFG